MNEVTVEEQTLLRKKRKADGNKALQASVCTDLAQLYASHNMFESAIKEYRQVASIYKSENKLLQFAQVHRGIGECHLGRLQFEAALENFKIYLKGATEARDSLEEQRALAQIGYTYQTWFLETPNDADPELMKSAFAYFIKSLRKCESLTGISRAEKMDMTARLFSNLGIVKECLGEYSKAEELFDKSIKICLDNDLYEQLYRGYLSIAALFEKQEKYDDSIRNLNLAIDAASKLKDRKVEFMCSALLTKADCLCKIADFNGAKYVLFKAYKLKTPIEADRILIERNLRTVAAMCYTEEEIVACSNPQELKTLYEKMGDGACELKNYREASQYYKKMLESAQKSGASDSVLASCYYSLAETYKDNKNYHEALRFYEKEYELVKNKLEDCLETTIRIADAKELAQAPVEEVRAVYERAFERCRQCHNLKEEHRLLVRLVTYLRRVNRNAKASELEMRAAKIKEEMGDVDSSSSDNESVDSSTKKELGADINLSDITDYSDNSDAEPTTSTEKGVGKRKRQNIQRFQKNNKGEWPLHRACIKGETKVVSHLIDSGHPINVRDNAGWLPLHEAAVHGHLDIVKLLVDKDAAINDRGGKDCDGITPLHDAAANGHLEVIEYLLDKGASPLARTDAGQSVLHELKSWYERESPCLRVEEQVLYDRIVKRLSEALNKAGKADGKENVQRNTSKTVKISPKFNQFRRKADISLSDDEDCDVRPHHSTVDTFKQVMDSMRRKPLVQATSSYRSPVKKQPALVDYDPDDWLEDDMGPAKKRTRHKYGISPPTEKKSRKSVERSELSFPEDTFDDGFEESLIMMAEEPAASENLREKRVSNESNSSSNSSKRKSQSSLLEAGFSRTRSITPPNITSQRRVRNKELRHEQKKITSFAQSKSFVEADSTCGSSPSWQFPEINLNPLAFSPLTPTTSKQMTPQMSQMAAQLSSLSQMSTMSCASDPTLFVDVKIQSKAFRVPVLMSQLQTKSVRWLAEEAASRYASKEFRKPTLELETSSGAVLADSDLLSLLFPHGTMHAEQVVANVVKWTVPPLKKRYKEACHQMEIDPEEEICTIAERISIILDLSDKALTDQQLSPLLKALNYETTLLELDLSGSFMDTNSVKMLCSSLPALVNLSTLNMSCVNLYASHVTMLADVFRSNDQVLRKLMNLNLSYNNLQNFILHDLEEIMKNIMLKTLDLASTGLKGSISESLRLNLSTLECLILNSNELTSLEVKKFLSWCDLRRLKCLNIARNRCVRVLERIMELPFEDNVLEVVNLSVCDVGDSELYDFLRLTTNLSTLQLSYNEDLTSISLRRLLEYNSLQCLDLIGCDNIFKYFEDSNSWSINFGVRSGDVNVLKVTYSCEESKIYCERLADTFRRKNFSCDIHFHVGFMEIKIKK